jgi:hypothetical protein
MSTTDIPEDKPSSTLLGLGLCEKLCSALVAHNERKKMTTTACAADWREIAEKASREAREWRENFNVLQRAMVGETGASGIGVAHAMRKDAERYRKWRAAYTHPDGTPHALDPMLAAIADAWTPEQLDAAIDAAPAVGAA